MKIFIPILVLSLCILALGCIPKNETNLRAPEPDFGLADCPIPIEHGKLYGNYGKKAEMELVLSELRLLVDDICRGNLNHLSAMLFGELGLFIDMKGHWTKDEVVRDLALEEGYFATYFFNQKLLDKKKGSVGNLTVQMALRSSHGLIIDYFFDSASEVEVQLKFRENPKNARYLINPVFAKIEGKWKLLRMF
jgi:hypothetical protein